MKILLCCFIISALAVGYCDAQNKTPEKHALLIAVGKYDLETTGWWNLSSRSDADLLYKTLLLLEFKPENIDSIINENATTEGVLKSLADLKKKVNPGDIVVVHYSGHGMQIPDNENGDETDHWDESLVLYGAKNPHKFNKPVDYSGYLRDDEFGKALEEIRTKIGDEGHLLVIMDSCHSGSATRNTEGEVVRGDHPYLPKGQVPVTNSEVELGFGASENQAGSSKGGKMIFISAAYAHEGATQTKDENGKKFGALTLAFSKALLNRSSNETYQSLFASVLSEIKRRNLRQTPTIEGEVNYAVFGGHTEPKKFFDVLRIEKDPSIITLKGGNLAGLFNDTEVAIVAAGKPLNDELIQATGTITKTDNFEAEVKLNTKFPFPYREGAWVYVTKQSFSRTKLGVDLSKIKDKIIKQKLIKLINESSLLESKSNADLVVKQSNNKLLIQNRTLDREIGSVMITNCESVLPVLTSYAKTSFLRQLELTNDNYKVSVKIIPVRVENNKPIFGEPLGNKKNGPIEIDLNQEFFLEIENLRDKITYFNILYLREDGEIKVIVPCLNEGSCEENPTSFELKPLEKGKKTCKLYTFKNLEESGMFKIILTDKPVNLCKNLFKPPSSGARNTSTNAFEEVLNKIGNNESAGLSSRAVGDTKATTLDLVISLRERK